MKINLSGVIQSRKHLYYGKEACYGITRANKSKFKIYLSELALKDGYMFSETVLHELLHLWFFILNGALKCKEISEKKQHEILESVIPIVLSRTDLIMKRQKSNEKIEK